MSNACYISSQLCIQNALDSSTCSLKHYALLVVKFSARLCICDNNDSLVKSVQHNIKGSPLLLTNNATTQVLI
jgi:hypothetical protein